MKSSSQLPVDFQQPKSMGKSAGSCKFQGVYISRLGSCYWMEEVLKGGSEAGGFGDSLAGLVRVCEGTRRLQGHP